MPFNKPSASAAAASGAALAAAVPSKVTLTILNAQSRLPLFPNPVIISFFPNTPDSSINASIISSILGLLSLHAASPQTAAAAAPFLPPPPASKPLRFIIEDPTDGSFVAVNSSIPTGESYNALLIPPPTIVPKPEEWSLSPTPSSSNKPRNSRSSLPFLFSSSGRDKEEEKKTEESNFR